VRRLDRVAAALSSVKTLSRDELIAVFKE